MKIWLDDLRIPPQNYVWCKSVNEAIKIISTNKKDIVELNLDHDLGDFAKDGGDGIKLIDWCIENSFFPFIILHTANPVGKKNMERTIQRYWP